MSNKITKLLSTRDGKRVSVYIDGEFTLSIEPQLIIDYQLYVGREVDKTLENILIERDMVERLYRKASEKLSKRLYSKFEITQYIRKQLQLLRKYKKAEISFDDTELVKMVIEKLDDNNYLDDKEYARWVITLKRNTKSEMELKKILTSKGVDSRTSNEVLIEYQFDNSAYITKFIDLKMRLLDRNRLSIKEKRDKIIQALMRKGYRYTEILEVLDK